jgi:hypothetical protein
LILKDVTSGLQTTTLGLPPLNSYLASGSPKVLDTDNLPGNTLIGPTIKSDSFYSSSYLVI